MEVLKSKQSYIKILFLLAIALIALFSLYKLWDVSRLYISNNNAELVLRICSIIYLASWALGSVLDVSYNNEILKMLNINIPMDFRTYLTYCLMILAFIFLCLSNDIVVFCCMMVVLVIIEMLNLNYIDKKWLNAVNQKESLITENSKKLEVLQKYMHDLFAGHERQLRNIINIMIPIAVIAINIFEIKYTSTFIIAMFLLLFILFSELWMMKIRFVMRKKIVDL
jgi:hypothetical protein